MKSNYKKIGDFVRQINKRNTDLKVMDLKGINIEKEFMPSVANVNGTDLSKYKIVQNLQFAFNPMHVGRDEVLPISLWRSEDPIIVSPAYMTFEVIDENVIDPEYLMIWFRRNEFDRNCWFKTDSTVRGGFSWDGFCELDIPFHDIEYQRKIVNEYNVFKRKLNLNNRFTKSLEEVVSTLYTEWFVNFNFPITEEIATKIGDHNLLGKPYKMLKQDFVYSKEIEMEIPRVFKVVKLDTLIESVSKTHQFDKDKVIFFNTSDILDGDFLHADYQNVENLPGQAKKTIENGDILFSEIRPKNKRFAIVNVGNPQDYVVSTKLMVLRVKQNQLNSYRIYHFLTSDQIIDILQKSAEGRSGTFPQITFETDIADKYLILADNTLEEIWGHILKNYYELRFYYSKQNILLNKILSIVTLKMI